MNIGIVTFWWSHDNYGQLLQCYALQRYLKEKGHNAYLIRYDSNSDILPKNILRFIKKNLMSVYTKIKFYKSIKKRNFDVFRQDYIAQSKNIYKSISELRNNPPKADIYIVGSDQVWSCIMSPIQRKKNLASAYFLDFGNNNVKRISYAASWGTDNISPEYEAFITPLLNRFSAVSVREKTGIALCKKCGVQKPVCVPDPTFLLSAKEYCNELLREQVTYDDDYIMLYLLNNTFNFNKQKIFDFAKNNKLQVKYVTGNGLTDSYEKIYATIPEWLNLIKNAKYVITNSFHCSVFSVLFHKQFGVIPLSGNYEKLNTRMLSLFELLKIDERFINEFDFSILNKPYTVDLNMIKQMGVAFLDGVINENC